MSGAVKPSAILSRWNAHRKSCRTGVCPLRKQQKTTRHTSYGSSYGEDRALCRELLLCLGPPLTFSSQSTLGFSDSSCCGGRALCIFAKSPHKHTEPHALEYKITCALVGFASPFLFLCSGLCKTLQSPNHTQEEAALGLSAFTQDTQLIPAIGPDRGSLCKFGFSAMYG